MINKFNYDLVVNTSIVKINDYLEQVDPLGLNFPRYAVDGLCVIRSFCDDLPAFTFFDNNDDLTSYLSNEYKILISKELSPVKFYNVLLSGKDGNVVDFVKNTDWITVDQVDIVDLGDLKQVDKVGQINVYFSATFNQYAFN